LDGSSGVSAHIDRNSSGYYNIFCPQALRPMNNPSCAQKQRAKLVSSIEKEISEATEEIQSILGYSTTTSSSNLRFGGISCFSPTESSEDSGPDGFTLRVYSPLTYEYSLGSERILQHSPVKFVGHPDTFSEKKGKVRRNKKKNGNLEAEEKGNKAKFNLLLRPKLGNSQSVLPTFPPGETANIPSVPLPVPTPPLRTHNPIPFNSSFSKIQELGTGTEFGLLSVSPPPLPIEEEDSFIRYDRLARIRRTMWRGDSSANSDDSNYIDSNDVLSF